jgi:hypothetical protein
MDWKVKAAVFRLLSVLPFGSAALLQLQKSVTHEVPRRAPALDELLLAARKVQLLYQQHAKGAISAGVEFVEIGAGRDLAVALALRMLGVSRIVCVDVARLARVELVQHAADHLARALGLPRPQFRSWGDIDAFGIEYLAPSRLEDVATAGRRFACFYSTDVLEHIPPTDLASMLSTSRGLLAPGGVAIQAIDYSDHYARSHAGLSRFNFLTFNAEAWRRYNPGLHYVNRLRHSEFVRLFRDAGYVIARNEPTVSAHDPDILQRLSSEFKSFDHDDLFTLRSWIVATSAARQPSPTPVPA